MRVQVGHNCGYILRVYLYTSTIDTATGAGSDTGIITDETTGYYRYRLGHIRGFGHRYEQSYG